VVAKKFMFFSLLFIIVIIMSLQLVCMARPRGQTVLAASFATYSGPSSLTTTRSSRKTTTTFVKTSNSKASSWNPLQFAPFHHHRPRAFSPFSSMMMSMSMEDDNNNDAEEVEDDGLMTQKTIHSEWNIKGLKAQVNRLIVRSHKKIGKASARVEEQKARQQQLLLDSSSIANYNSNNNMQSSKLFEYPSPADKRKEFERDLEELQLQLQRLNLLNELLAKVPSSSGKNAGVVVLPLESARLAIDLGVDDKPPAQQSRGPGKAKGPRITPKTRLPYRRYYSQQDNTEIRVRT
jgi:hypothetical protein